MAPQSGPTPAVVAGLGAAGGTGGSGDGGAGGAEEQNEQQYRALLRQEQEAHLCVEELLREVQDTALHERTERQSNEARALQELSTLRAHLGNMDRLISFEKATQQCQLDRELSVTDGDKEPACAIMWPTGMGGCICDVLLVRLPDRGPDAAAALGTRILPAEPGAAGLGPPATSACSRGACGSRAGFSWWPHCRASGGQPDSGASLGTSRQAVELDGLRTASRTGSRGLPAPAGAQWPAHRAGPRGGIGVGARCRGSFATSSASGT
uniref:Uncharacterized protein n=1 Tax=Alexandrium monilatum TaxID=311494 RepID=A0A7S4PV15_9DINO